MTIPKLNLEENENVSVLLLWKNDTRTFITNLTLFLVISKAYKVHLRQDDHQNRTKKGQN